MIPPGQKVLKRMVMSSLYTHLNAAIYCVHVDYDTGEYLIYNGILC